LGYDFGQPSCVSTAIMTFLTPSGSQDSLLSSVSSMLKSLIPNIDGKMCVYDITANFKPFLQSSLQSFLSDLGDLQFFVSVGDEMMSL